MTDPTTYELDGQIATITIDDGKVNALSIGTLEAIHAALDKVQRDGAVLVLTGRERFFSAGFDLQVFAGPRKQIVEMVRLGATLAERLLSFPTPVVIACSGHAVAAGSFPLLAADFRIGVAGPFQIGLNEVKIGITVPWFAIELARHRLHPAHFDRAVVTAHMYGPDEAVVAGLLDQVVPVGELASASLKAATALAALDLPAYAATKHRARARAMEAVRSAIETALARDILDADAPPSEPTTAGAVHG
jgi:enoyl-CoA hydratase